MSICFIATVTSSCQHYHCYTVQGQKGSFYTIQSVHSADSSCKANTGAAQETVSLGLHYLPSLYIIGPLCVNSQLPLFPVVNLIATRHQYKWVNHNGMCTPLYYMGICIGTKTINPLIE